jgi:hypothetical protein
VLGRPEDHLYGCAVMLAAVGAVAATVRRQAGGGPVGKPTAAAASASASAGGGDGGAAAGAMTTYLFTWSEDEFASLLDVLSEWLGPPARAAGAGASSYMNRPAVAAPARTWLTEEGQQRSLLRRARCAGPRRLALSVGMPTPD